MRVIRPGGWIGANGASSVAVSSVRRASGLGSVDVDVVSLSVRMLRSLFGQATIDAVRIQRPTLPAWSLFSGFMMGQAGESSAMIFGSNHAAPVRRFESKIEYELSAG